MTWRVITIFCMMCLALNLYGQAEEPLSGIDTLGKQKAVSVIGLPFVFYTPETSLGFGAGAQIFLNRSSNIYNARLSNVLVSVVYTLNKQLLIDVAPQIYFGKGDWFLDAGYKYQVFPNAFWGIGNTTPDSDQEPYEMTSSELRIAFLRRLPNNLNFGFEVTSQVHKMTEVLEGGILDEGEVEGSEGASIQGVGAIFNMDSRDVVESPTDGYFMQLNANFSSKLLGADYTYNKFILDARSYHKLAERGALALQIYFEGSFGVVPFQTMATYGGGERARGYFRGRFIDNHQYVLQAEYRWRFKPRWVLAVFALMGEVADLPRNFFSDLKPAFGAGARFQLFKSTNTLLRFDLGFGKDGSSGFYFGDNEAF